MDKQNKIRIFRYNAATNQVHIAEWDVRKVMGALLVAGTGFIVSFALFIILTFNLQDNRQISALERQNQVLQEHLARLSEKASAIEQQIQHIKQQDEQLRIFASLPVIDEDTWTQGTGGAELDVDEETGFLPKPIHYKITEIEKHLGKFQKQLGLAEEGTRQIQRKLQENFDLLSHTPSIRPVVDGIITSRFGYRTDPFIQKKKMHNGIDLLAKPGTPVIAPADGVVEFVRSQYSLGETYGKVVVINHGRGVKTRFGHLGKIYVKVGQRVKRFDPIGQVGNTGRSTGPHLHYEVIVHNHFRDPLAYILD
ncbi:MAG: hypothetical protein D6814_03185 [Calditrichaeota bacterium]|nr:MAG: hypothetical protein D6814_03185 [Calditrichota bacterium]